MQICKGEDKRSVAILAADKMVENAAHHGQRGQLLLTVVQIVDGIRLVVDAVIVASQQAQEIRLYGRIGRPPLDRCGDSLVFKVWSRSVRGRLVKVMKP